MDPENVSLRVEGFREIEIPRVEKNRCDEVLVLIEWSRKNLFPVNIFVGYIFWLGDRRVLRKSGCLRLKSLRLKCLSRL
jgi:hypothetical protein